MEHTFSVRELSNYIKQVVDAEAIWDNILVMGEVSSYSVTRGIAYFNIKDEDSLLSCVLFGAEKFGEVKIGDVVLLRGSVKYYAKGGKLSFNAISLQQYGKGELYQKYLLLKEKLEKEGLFDLSHKHPLPQTIKRIGVVTSRTGAVIRDIINVANRRNPMLDIVLYNAQVQGNCAVEQIIEGIDFFENYDSVDVIVVARGGGSIEDLQPFNEELLARRVYDCKKPIISAVGHETDFTIIDFVSDLRAPTPSAAAELVTLDLSGVLDRVKNNQSRLISYTQRVLSQLKLNAISRVHKIKNTLDIEFNNTYNHVREKVFHINDNITSMIQELEYKMGLNLNVLDKLNPVSLLKKGYSQVVKDNDTISSVSQLFAGDAVKLTLIDGNANAKIVSIEERL